MSSEFREVTWLGHETIRLGRCASTSDEVCARAAAGAAHGLVVVADEQTAGRGRHGRSWHSPAGQNLYLSCLLRPALAAREVAPITLAAGIAVCDVVNSAGARASLKWPNDVLAGGRKLAGILTEMQSRGDRVEHVVLGIGVNVNAGSGSGFPPDLAPTATSLALELGAPVARDDLLARLLLDLERWLDRFLSGGLAAIADAWLERAALGQVRARAGNTPVEGRAVGLGPGGELLLVDRNGKEHTIVAGDVEVLPLETGADR